LHALIAVALVVTVPHTDYNAPTSPSAAVSQEICSGLVETTPNEMADWSVLQGYVWDREHGLRFVFHTALGYCPDVLIGHTPKERDLK